MAIVAVVIALKGSIGIGSSTMIDSPIFNVDSDDHDDVKSRLLIQTPG